MTSVWLHTHLFRHFWRARAHNNWARARESDRQAAGSRGRATPQTLTSRPTISAFCHAVLCYGSSSKWKEMKFEFSRCFARSALSIPSAMLTRIEHFFNTFFFCNGAHKSITEEKRERDNHEKSSNFQAPKRPSRSDRAVKTFIFISEVSRVRRRRRIAEKYPLFDREESFSIGDFFGALSYFSFIF